MLFNMKCFTLAAMIALVSSTVVSAVHQATSTICLYDSDMVCKETVTLLLDLDAFSLTTSFTQTSVTDPLYAHIHMGARGTDGGVMSTLCADATECLAAVSSTTVLTKSQFHMLITDSLYINLHSTAMPSGALRGQITMGDNAFTTTLSNDLNVASGDTTATGSFAAFYDTSTGYLWWSLTHTVAGANAAHLHNAVAGATGSATHTLCADAASCTLSDGYVTGVATLTSEHGWKLANDAMYINIHSETYASGAIRGNLVLGGQRFVTKMTAEQEVETGDTTKSGSMRAFVDEWRNKIVYAAMHDVTDATGFHLHGPAGMMASAGLLADLSDALTQGSMLVGATTPSVALKAAFYADHVYVNVHSPAFTAGAIRGQLWVDTVSTGTVALNDANNVVSTSTTATGEFTGVFDPATMTLMWTLTHTVTDATAIHLHSGAPGATGSALHVLAANAAQALASMSGATTLTQASAKALLSNGMYINIHSTAFPDGAIRGNILWRNVIGMKTTSTLTGAAEVGTVGDSSKSGMAWAVYNPHSMKLVTVVMHDVTDATGVHVHGPASASATAGVLNAVGPQDGTSPSTAVSMLTTAGAAAYISGMTYFNIHSPSHPSGAIRGQIMPYANAFMAPLSATLDASAGDATKSGTFYGVYDGVRHEFFWTLTHDVTDATAVHLHSGAPGATGGVLYTLAASSETASVAQTTGWMTMSQATAFALITEGIYLNIHSTSFPSSALRANLKLSGTKVMVPLTGAAEVGTVGDSSNSGTFYGFYDSNTWRFTTAFMSTIAAADITGVHLHGPASATETASVLHALTSGSNQLAETVFLTMTSSSALTTNMVYVNIHTTAFPSGALRGQIDFGSAPAVTKMAADPNPPTTAATHTTNLASTAAWSQMLPGTSKLNCCSYNACSDSSQCTSSDPILLDCTMWAGTSAEAIVVSMMTGDYTDYVKPAVGGSLCSLLNTSKGQTYRASSSPEGPWVTATADDDRMLGGGLPASLVNGRDGVVGPYWGSVANGMPTGTCGHQQSGDFFVCQLDMMMKISVVWDWSPYMATSGTHFLTSASYTDGIVSSAAAATSSTNYARKCGMYDAAGSTGLFVRVTMGTYVDYFKPTTTLCKMLTEVGQWYWHSMTAPSMTSQSWGGVVGNHQALLGGWATYGTDTRTWGTFWGAPAVGGYYAEAGGCCENAPGAPIQFWRAFRIDLMIV